MTMSGATEATMYVVRRMARAAQAEQPGSPVARPALNLEVFLLAPVGKVARPVLIEHPTVGDPGTT